MTCRKHAVPDIFMRGVCMVKLHFRAHDALYVHIFVCIVYIWSRDTRSKHNLHSSAHDNLSKRQSERSPFTHARKYTE